MSSSPHVFQKGSGTHGCQHTPTLARHSSISAAQPLPIRGYLSRRIGLRCSANLWHESSSISAALYVYAPPHPAGAPTTNPYDPFENQWVGLIRLRTRSRRGTKLDMCTEQPQKASHRALVTPQKSNCQVHRMRLWGCELCCRWGITSYNTHSLNQPAIPQLLLPPHGGACSSPSSLRACSRRCVELCLCIKEVLQVEAALDLVHSHRTLLAPELNLQGAAGGEV